MWFYGSTTYASAIMIVLRSVIYKTNQSPNFNSEPCTNGATNRIPHHNMWPDVLRQCFTDEAKFSDLTLILHVILTLNLSLSLTLTLDVGSLCIMILLVEALHLTMSTQTLNLNADLTFCVARARRTPVPPCFLPYEPFGCSKKRHLPNIINACDLISHYDKRGLRSRHEVV